MKKDLSKIKKIDLRDIWNHEALDFTKWLAEEENLNLLSEAIGVDIKLIEVEADVGRYNVDILAEEEITGNKIIIENQLEYTNHDHLGKLITYASGHNAKTVIWIVKDSREEHINAIEWLNENTDDSLNFFLINIELWQIDDSKPAPRFEVIVRPNEWAKTFKTASGSNELSNNSLLQLNYWEKFNEFCKSNHPEVRMQKPHAKYYLDYSHKEKKFNITSLLYLNESRLGTQIYIPNDKDLFSYLLSFKEEIEKQIGSSLKWNEARKACTIMLKRDVKNLTNELNNDSNFVIHIKDLKLFEKVFTPYVKDFYKGN